jgi:hypothetical protein
MNTFEKLREWEGKIEESVHTKRALKNPNLPTDYEETMLELCRAVRELREEIDEERTKRRFGMP